MQSEHREVHLHVVAALFLFGVQQRREPILHIDIKKRRNLRPYRWRHDPLASTSSSTTRADPAQRAPRTSATRNVALPTVVDVDGAKITFPAPCSVSPHNLLISLGQVIKAVLQRNEVQFLSDSSCMHISHDPVRGMHVCHVEGGYVRVGRVPMLLDATPILGEIVSGRRMSAPLEHTRQRLVVSQIAGLDYAVANSLCVETA